MDLKIIYEDNNLLVVDKPAGVVVFEEVTKDTKETRETKDKTLIDLLIDKYPALKTTGEAPRYGIVHRLDKDTSGVLLVAKNNEVLIFLQKQFRNRTIQKKYIALAIGEIKDEKGTIDTLIARSPKDGKKQKVFLSGEPGSEGKRQAVTEYKVLERYKGYKRDKGDKGNKGYTLLEVAPKTGRKHQIRCHLAHINHPIAGDKIYGFKNQPTPKNLTRHFLHASYLKFELPGGETKEINSELPEELKNVIKDLNPNVQTPNPNQAPIL